MQNYSSIFCAKANPVPNCQVYVLALFPNTFYCDAGERSGTQTGDEKGSRV